MKVIEKIISFLWEVLRLCVLSLVTIIKTVWGLIVFCVLCAVIGGTFLYVKLEPMYTDVREKEYDRLMNLSADSFELMRNTRVYDNKGELLGEVNVAEYKYIPVAQVSRHIQEGYIAVEDRDFKKHMGISIKGLARAGLSLVKNSGGITQGGSTITQQVVKNNLLSQERTFSRKFTELFLAMDIERKFTKADIMEFYVNTNFYGNRCYGVEAASQYYFGKSAKDVTVSEAAMLVGMSNSPSNYNPVANEDLAIKKRNQVLDVMEQCGVITEKERDKAKEESIEIVKKREERVPASYEVSYAIYSATLKIMEDRGFEFEYTFKDRESYEVYKERYSKLYNQISDEIRNGGYDIYTALDKDKQKILQASVDDTLKELKEKQDNGKYAVQGAAVMVDNQSNYVVAIVGGRGTKDEYNRGYLSMRQPGSTIKPLVDYAPAFETGNYYPSLIMTDQKLSNGPSNSNGKYKGKVSMRSAIEQSLNTIAYQTLKGIGVSKGLSYLDKLRFSTISYIDNTNLSVSLGGFTNGVRVVDMAKGYATLANGGEYSDKSCIVKIEHQKEGVIYVAEEQEEKTQVYGEDVAWLMTDCLRGVLSDRGTGKGLEVKGQDCAGKSGTTNESKDGWFCGYTPYYTTAIWVGRDDNKPITGMYGATYAGKIWSTAMNKVHKEAKLEKIPFEMPRSVALKNVNYLGLAVSYTTGRTDYFSTQAEERAKREAQEKRDKEIRTEIESVVSNFELLEITSVEDCYTIESKYKEVLTKLGVVTNETDHKKFLKRVANKYDILLTQKKDWVEDMIIYEEAKELREKEAAKEREEQAAKDKIEREKQTTINRFKAVLKIVQDTKVVTDYTYRTLDKASRFLSKCAEYDEYYSLKALYDAEVERIPKLEVQNKKDAEEKKKKEEEEAKAKEEREQADKERLEAEKEQQNENENKEKEKEKDNSTELENGSTQTDTSTR